MESEILSEERSPEEGNEKDTYQQEDFSNHDNQRN